MSAREGSQLVKPRSVAEVQFKPGFWPITLKVMAFLVAFAVEGYFQ